MTRTPPLIVQPNLSAPADALERASWRRVALGMALALVGGAGLIASFPPIGAWPLILISFVPISVAQHRVLPARWAGLAPTIGIGSYITYLAWGGLTASQRWWLVLLIPVLVLTGQFDRRAQWATGLRHLWWSGPVLWTGALFVVGLTPLASWLDPAYALYRQPWLIQPVSVFALSGLNLVILLTNYGIAAAVLSTGLRRRALLVGGVAVLLTAWISTSAVLLSHSDSGRALRVAVIQPGRNTHNPATPAAAQASNAAMLAVLERGTRRAANDGAQLVVWPEKAFQDMGPGNTEWRNIERIAATAHVYLVVGYSPDPRRFNQAAVLDPSGRVLVTYNKQHPVSFAGDHSTGGPVVVASTPLGRIAPIICYDLDFENTARDATRKGAQLLAVPSEDWAGIADQHYTHLVFRAVENHVAAAKADTAWDSAIIDSHGRIHAAQVDTSSGSAVLVATIPLGSGRSPFVTTGNWIGWTCVALSVVWLLIAAARMRSDVRTTG